MARGPYQGTYQPNARPTVVTAPDTLVFFNGETDLTGCNQCHRSFDVNKYITSVTVDLSVDSSPGSASISLSVPRHTIDDFYFEGNPVLCPMMEVEIFSKGYYLVEGVPQYYPIFWGMITEVGDSYSDGVHTVSVSCQDILKWWELTTININPAYTAPTPRLGRSLSGNVFNQANPYDMIMTLASQSFGDVITATGSFVSLIREGADRQVFDTALTDIMIYWEQRFSKMRRNLIMYGVNGAAIRGDTLFQEYVTRGVDITPNSKIASTAIRNANGGPESGQAVFDPASPDVVAYKLVTSNIGGFDLLQSEFMTKIELANAAKEAIGFEFFMDVTGDLVFKPPFFNLDVLANKPVSWVQDIDIISWDFSESESEVITHITLTGSYRSTVNYGIGEDILPHTAVIDYHLLRRFGWRTTTYNSEYLTTDELIFFHGLDVLDRINSKRHRGSVVIPLRPELRLGFPIYIASKDEIWYISGISHNISFGSRATTTLNLTSRRAKFIAPRGIGKLKLESYPGGVPDPADGEPSAYKYSSKQLAEHGTFALDVTNAVTLPDTDSDPSDSDQALQAPLLLRHPKTGRIVGYPNVVMTYTRPFLSDDIAKQGGYRGVHRPDLHESKINQSKSEANRQAYMDFQTKTFSYNRDSELRDRYMTNRYQYGLNSAGVFVYAHDVTSVISEALVLPHPSLNVTPKSEGAPDPTGSILIRPISDERGFEVVGHYRYGRRVYLKDGKIIASDPGRARVDFQLALTGGLSETLTAQSQGLTSISTGYQTMGEQLATLSPEDKGTTVNPNREKEKTYDAGEKSVDTAVLGSFEQKGVVTAEASQFSMALTLNEMSVRQATTFGGEECVCLLGRQDLAFLGGDYQIRTLSGEASEDVTGLFPQSFRDLGVEIGEGATAGIDDEEIAATKKEIASIEAALVSIQTELQTTDPSQEADLQLAYLETTEELDAAKAKLTEILGRGRPIEVGATQAAAREVNTLQLNLARMESELQLADKAAQDDPELTQIFTDLQSAYLDAQEELAAAQSRLNELRSTPEANGSIFTKTNEEVISRVESFLTKLYKSLDDSHQEFEQAIRGDLLPQTPSNLPLNGDATNPQSEFAPPFSAPHRFQLGDPKADIAGIQSNAKGITEAFKSFGDDLRSNTEKTKLSTKISQDQASVARLSATKKQLESQKASSDVVLGINLDKQISSLTQEIDKLNQEISDNQLKLGAL